MTSDQVEVARTLYEHDHPIAAIASRLDTNYDRAAVAASALLRRRRNESFSPR